MANTKVTTGVIKDDAVGADQLASNSVVTASIVDNAITTAKINDDAILTAKISNSAITNAKMSANSVDSDQYVDGSIDTAHIGDGQITSAKLDTNISVSGELTVGSHLNMGDGDILKMGASDDLQIYHDGSHSYIDELVTGDLRIRSNSAVALLKSSDNADMLVAIPDGAVTLYYAGSAKIATTSSGINVTGTAVTDGLTATGVIVTEGDAAVNDAQIGRLNFTNTNSNASANPIRASILAGRQNSAWGGYLSLYTSTGTDAASEKVRIDETGNVLVGTTTFNNLSTESGVLASNNVVMARGGLTDHQDACGVLQYSSNATWLRAYGDTAGSGYLIFRTGGGAGSSDTERMRIDSSGRVGIAQDAPADFNSGADDLVIGNSGGDFGITIRTGTSNTGNIFFADGVSGNQQYRGSIQYQHSGDAMIFGTDGGTERMRIRSDGNVTKPTQCNFLARRSGNQTGYNASGSYGDGVRYNSEIYDIGGDFDVTTGIFTAPVDGTYLIQGSVYSNTAGTNWSQAWLAVNNARADYTDMMGNDGDLFISTTHIVKLSAGDEVRYHPYYSGSTSVTILANNNHTWFKGYLLG